MRLNTAFILLLLHFHILVKEHLVLLGEIFYLVEVGCFFAFEVFGGFDEVVDEVFKVAVESVQIV